MSSLTLHEIAATAVTAKVTGEQNQGSEEPVRTSHTDQVLNTNSVLEPGSKIMQCYLGEILWFASKARLLTIFFFTATTNTTVITRETVRQQQDSSSLVSHSQHSSTSHSGMASGTYKLLPKMVKPAFS